MNRYGRAARAARRDDDDAHVPAISQRATASSAGPARRGRRRAPPSPAPGEARTPDSTAHETRNAVCSATIAGKWLARTRASTREGAGALRRDSAPRTAARRRSARGRRDTARGGHHRSSTSSEQNPGPMAMSMPRSPRAPRPTRAGPAARRAPRRWRVSHSCNDSQCGARRRAAARALPRSLQHTGPPVWQIQWRTSARARPCAPRKASTSPRTRSRTSWALAREHHLEPGVDDVPAHHPLGAGIEIERVPRRAGRARVDRAADQHRRAPSPKSRWR